MNKKIVVSLAVTILLAFTTIPVPVRATATSTHSGIDLHRYHWICLESDDWGVHNTWDPANVTELNYLVSKGVYNTGFWGQSTLESVSDLNGLYAVLAKHPGVPITPNFVMEMINGSAMQSNGFTQYVGIPINKTGWINETKYGASTPNYRGDLNDKWLEGYQKGYWLPEMHGRTHANMDWFLQNCSQGFATTIDCIVNHSTCFLRLPGETAYPLTSGEFIRNPILTVQLGNCNESILYCQDDINVASQDFYNLFGYWPETMCCPSYLCSNNAIVALKNSTIYGVTCDLGYGYNKVTGLSQNWGWNDFQIIDGVSLLTARSIYTWDGNGLSALPNIMGQVNNTFTAGQVAQMNIHKINYEREISDILDPGRVDSALSLLDHFITLANQIYDNIWWLTTPELAQLNIRGYSIQNWSDKIVVRNAIGDRNIDVPMPLGFHVNRLAITNSSSVNMTYSVLNSHTIRINVPHNETFTILKVSIFNYDAQISALVPIFVAATIVVLIMAVISKGVIGPFSRLFRRIDL